VIPTTIVVYKHVPQETEEKSTQFQESGNNSATDDISVIPETKVAHTLGLNKGF
jgi:hypothetical protein